MPQLCVGYETRVRPDIQIPEFKPQDRLVDEAAKARDIERQREKFLREVGQSVYTAQLHRVCIAEVAADPSAGKLLDTGVGDEKSVIESTIEFLGEHYSEAWGSRSEALENIVTFYGFNPKLFLKLLGIGGAIYGMAVPIGLWYENRDHRDLENALLPSDCKPAGWTLQQAIAQLYKVSLPRPDWSPLQNAEEDATLAAMVAVRLGIITPPRRRRKRG